MPHVVNPPSVMPDAFNPPSVIPDIFNRESKSSPMQAHTNKTTTKQAPGFPLTLSPTFVIGETSGNDRGETGRHDKEARQA